MNDSLQEVVNLFSLKDLLDIIFLLDCSVMQPLRFPHDDQNPISFVIKVQWLIILIILHLYRQLSSSPGTIGNRKMKYFGHFQSKTRLLIGWDLQQIGFEVLNPMTNFSMLSSLSRFLRSHVIHRRSGIFTRQNDCNNVPLMFVIVHYNEIIEFWQKSFFWECWTLKYKFTFHDLFRLEFVTLLRPRLCVT